MNPSNNDYWESTGSQNTFIHLRRGRTDVVSIRGTGPAAEMLQDPIFFLPAIVLQLARIIGPRLFDMNEMMSTIISMQLACSGPSHSWL